MLWILNVGTVPTLCILYVGTVPMLCILSVGTVTTFSHSLEFVFFYPVGHLRPPGGQFVFLVAEQLNTRPCVYVSLYVLCFCYDHSLSKRPSL